jgi:hypothetical protein
MLSMTYPGDLSSWKAERSVSATIPVWRLSQPTAFGPTGWCSAWPAAPRR